ncbi:MAG: hypothetical protein ACPKPY_01330 [Nitrososphaeraceae archaeon]
MNKIKDKRLFLLFSFSVIIITIVLVTTSISSLQIVYSEDEIEDNNIGKFFTSPILSIQQAKSGSISEINSSTFVLELNDISAKTVSFTDRSDRNVKSITTEHFIDVWEMLKGAEESYAKVPPNAALIFEDAKEEQEIFVIELYRPEYNEDKKILNYDFKVIDNSTFSDLPLDFGQASLLIDGGYGGCGGKCKT